MSDTSESQSPPPRPPKISNSNKRNASITEIEVDLELPEPPSKKAKRLIKKGKPVPKKPSSDDGSGKESDDNDDGVPGPAGKSGKEGRAKKPLRSQHGIWIGNLDFAMTRLELFKWLVDNSGETIKEENITRVNLPTNKAAGKEKRTGECGESKPQSLNKGFAYIDFDSEAAVVAAMALTETQLNGRRVLIKNSNSFEGRPQKPGDPTNAADGSGEGKDCKDHTASLRNNRKIFVGNLPFETTEDHVRTKFEKCGEISWAKVATFPDSGKCKGYGWVMFKDSKAAEWAVKGFVRIKEDIETEEDFNEPKSDYENGEKPERKTKMRKWWVNRLMGKELKVQFAEDDQVRYKKRFGKDAPRKKEAYESRPLSRSKADKPAEESQEVFTSKKQATYGDSSTVAYRTGGVVKSQGRKTTFD